MSGLGLILPGAGGSQPDYVYPVPLDGAGSAAWPSANQGIFRKVRFDKATVATGLLLPHGGTVNGNVKCGLYSSDKTTLTQLALSTGDTANANGSDNQAVLFAASVPVAPFIDYYWFMVCSNNTATYARWTIVAAALSLTARLAYVLDSAYTTPPATQLISGMTGGSIYVPALAVITTG